MAYRGVFSTFTKPEKYVGDISKVTYRSLWERSVMVWLDSCPQVTKWSSETFIVDYYDHIHNKSRQYYVDFYMQMSSGAEFLIEVKPDKETKQPVQKARKTRNFLHECATYEINQAKWTAAKKVAELYGMKFDVWTEHHLKKLGIIKEFAAGNKTLLRAERRALPNSKYNPQVKAKVKLRQTKTAPKRRS